MTTAEFAPESLQTAECLVSAAQVNQAITRLAGEISASLATSKPVVLVVMNGGLIFAGQLLPQLPFPLQIDYCQVSRYGDRSTPGQLEWRVRPKLSLQGRSVLIVDDILDEGATLLALIDACRQLGASQVASAVLCDKRHTRKMQPQLRADFTGVEIPDRFVFGSGMDVQGWGRNFAGLWALPEA